MENSNNDFILMDDETKNQILSSVCMEYMISFAHFKEMFNTRLFDDTFGELETADRIKLTTFPNLIFTRQSLFYHEGPILKQIFYFTLSYPNYEDIDQIFISPSARGLDFEKIFRFFIDNTERLYKTYIDDKKEKQKREEDLLKEKILKNFPTEFLKKETYNGK